MAEKASASKKKLTGAKVATRKRVTKGDSVKCEVCGLSVVVERVGGIAVSQETTLFCCGKPMKAHKASRKATVSKQSKVVQTVSGWPQAPVAGSSAPVADPKEDVNQQ